MVGVEIGHAQMRDAALALELGQPAHGVEIARVVEQPPVELQQVDALDPQARQAAADAGAHHVGRHVAGLGAPFGQHRRASWPPAGISEQPAGDLLGTAVVVGHVEGVEARVGIGAQGLGGTVEIQRPTVALHVRDLPQPGHDAADLEAGGELAALGPGRRALGHAVSSAMVLSGTGLIGGRGAKKASSSSGRPEALMQVLGQQRPAIAALAAAHAAACRALDRAERGGSVRDGAVDARQGDLLAAADDRVRLGRRRGRPAVPRTVATGRPGTAAAAPAPTAPARPRHRLADLTAAAPAMAPSASAARAPPVPQQSPTARTPGTLVRQSASRSVTSWPRAESKRWRQPSRRRSSLDGRKP